MSTWEFLSTETRAYIKCQVRDYDFKIKNNQSKWYSTHREKYMEIVIKKWSKSLAVKWTKLL